MSPDEAPSSHIVLPRVEGTTKRALITGITGQDGSYLAELLLDKGYEVHGIVRRSSSFNTDRIDHLYHDPHEPGVRLFTHYGDLTDAVALTKLIYELQPDEIYHLGAQSHVRVSFDIPEYTFDVTAAGTLRLLEAMREAGVAARFYQASSSEMFGAAPPPQSESTPFHPRSPYAVAKVAALLGDRQLPRGLRPVRRQRDPLQPRVAAPRRDLRHPQDHAGRRADQGRPAGEAVPRQPRGEARLGLRARLRRGDVADAAGRRAGRLRARHRRDPHGAGGLRGRLRPRRASTTRRPRRDRPALLPALRGGRPARRRLARPRASSAGSRR